MDFLQMNSKDGIVEFALATKIASRLSESGSCVLEYVTAEMQPFSNSQRPDLVYTPKYGPYSGQIIFIEVKTTLRRSLVNELDDHFEFAEDCIGSKVLIYFYVTNEHVSDLLKQKFRKKRIHVIDNVKSDEDVIEALQAFGL